MTLILASASAIRSQLLEAAGIEFTTQPARVDETALRASLSAENISVRDQADALAEMKALKISNKNPDALVLGCDQTLEFNKDTITKPANPKILADQIKAMQNQWHMLHSALVIYENGQPLWRHVETVRLHMRPLSDQFIQSYVQKHWDQLQYTVGGYMIEKDGIKLFDRIEGDVFAIQGLPMIPLINWLTIRQEISF